MVSKVLMRELDSYSNIKFEPTINIFKNAILFSYKKIGTRFFKQLLAYPNSIEDSNNRQLDIHFNRIYDNTFNGNLKLLYKNYQIETPWDLISDDVNHIKTLKTLKWDSNKSFFKDMKVKNFTELFLKNKTKDIIFLVRNPVERFFSGMIQVINYQLEELRESESKRNLLKDVVGMTDHQLKNLIRYFNIENLDENLDVENLKKYFIYILDHRFGQIYQNIHIEPYLHGYRELIYNIKDDSKIKVINLDDCDDSYSSINFFTELDDNPDLRDFFKHNSFESKKFSNKFAYSFLMEMYENNEFRTPNVFHHLKTEYCDYLDLISSKYFVKINENISYRRQLH
jgi:hypothetical protein